jgi:hypothetical protein
MIDFALASIGVAAAVLDASGLAAALNTRPLTSNTPAVLNKPTRTAWRLEMGKLKHMPGG